MNKKAIRVLEYEKIRDMLVAECMSSLTREEAARLLPSSDALFIRCLLDKALDLLCILDVLQLQDFVRCIAGIAFQCCKAEDPLAQRTGQLGILYLIHIATVFHCA